MLAHQPPLGLPQRPRQRAAQARQGHELAVIPVAPAVNRLLRIAHDQTASAHRQHVSDELHEVVPLGDGRVLEFVDEDVLVARADALEDEGRRIFAYDARNLCVERRKRPHIALLAEPVQLVAQQGKHADEADFADQNILQPQLCPAFPEAHGRVRLPQAEQLGKYGLHRCHFIGFRGLCPQAAFREHPDQLRTGGGDAEARLRQSAKPLDHIRIRGEIAVL